MKLVDGIAAWLGYRKALPGRGRSFAAADINRLTASMHSEVEYINTVLRYQLRRLRGRSRQAGQNNPFARRFVKMVTHNVAGARPFQLRAKVRLGNGSFDRPANQRIEEAYHQWSRVGNCEITGRWSLAQFIRLVLSTWATDGEVLIRRRKGPEYGPYGYQLELVDIDRLDETFNETRADGSAVVMGVELNADARPVAYHLRKRKPASWETNVVYERVRVPADEIWHLFVPEIAEQARGVPPMYAALLNLVHLGAFEEAAVVAARIGATQMGIITSPDGTPPPLGQNGGETTQQDPVINAEPGTFPVLPRGYTLESWNPKYPDAAIGPFVKALLRGVSVGLDVAYHNLSGDMEGVNYSSARIAELDERDCWETLQDYFIEHLMEPMYAEWRSMAALTGALPVQYAAQAKYAQVRFQGRRWQWVDPLKETQSGVAAIEARLKSRTQIAAEQGDDFEEVVAELASEQQLMEEYGLKNPAPAAAPAAPAEPNDDPASDDDPEGADDGQQ